MHQDKFKLLNPAVSFAMTHESSLEFLSEISAEVEKGFGFVPLIGAGVSAPSGVPVMAQLIHYLHRCIALVLGVEQNTSQPELDYYRRWNPRLDNWPRLTDALPPPPVGWTNLVYAAWQEERSRTTWSRELVIFQEAFGAMADWRTSLIFLSRIEQKTVGAGQFELSLSAPKQDVIDSFFLHVTSSKRPNLSHQIIALLAAPMRISTILTTNFDDLFEQAFQTNGTNTAVFDVQLQGGLPQAAALQRAIAIVKLHGGRFGLRGDYSLDELPSETDMARFRSFFHGLHTSVSANVQYFPCNKHLLVIGLSPRDARIVAFIKDSLQYFGPAYRIFWVCYSMQDIEDLKDVFADIELPKENVQVLRHTQCGLLLLQLYQMLSKGLPPREIPFPALSRLPVPPLPWNSAEPIDPKAAKEGYALTQSIEKRISACQDSGYKSERIGIVYGTAHGITSAAATVFDRLKAKGQGCLWIDMSDIESTDDLFEQLLEAVAHEIGSEDWTPVIVQEDGRSRAKELGRLTIGTRSHWVFFINARETPGANSIVSPIGFAASQMSISHRTKSLLHMEYKKSALPNGWFDEKENSQLVDSSGNATALLKLLKELSEHETRNITIILLLRGNQSNSNQGCIQTLAAAGEKNGSGFAKENWISHHTTSIPFNERTAIKEVFKYFFKGGKHLIEELSALLMIVLMERTRYSASIFYSQTTDRLSTNELEIRKRLFDALLKTPGLARWKAGGFLWLHTPTRTLLRAVLFEGASGKNGFKTLWPAKIYKLLTKVHPAKLVPEVHISLAKWYERLLEASGSPAAVMEAVYHYCEAARASVVVRLPQNNRRKLIIDAMHNATSLLLRTESIIRNRGIANANRRRLNKIITKCDAIDRQLALSNFDKEADVCNSVYELRKRALIVSRAISREVADYSSAYAAHRQLCELVVTRRIVHTRNDRNTDALKQKIKGYSFNGITSFTILSALDLWVKRSENPVLRSLMRFEENRAARYLRWWYWLGMLGRGSRSLHRAERAFIKALQAIASKGGKPRSVRRRCDISQSPITYDVDQLLEYVRKSLAGETISILGVKIDKSEHGDCRLMSARICEQYAQLLLDQDNLHRRVNHGQEDCMAFNSADNFVTLAFEIIQGIDTSHVDNGSKLWSSIQRVRTRLFLHRGTIDACRSVVARFPNAFDNAEATLESVDPSRRSTLWAAVGLHRAEASLEWAIQTYVVTSLGEMKFDQMCSKARESGSLCTLIKEDESWNTISRKVLAGLDDARRSLDAAKELLMNRRRNVWWTTWCFQRYLRLIECEIWARYGDKSGLIPYVGLQAAPRLSPTSADEMLENAIRLIRFDSYRLATIVDAYADVCIATNVRLVEDKRAEQMPYRQHCMLKNLEAALKSLKHVHKKRIEIGKGDAHSVSPLVGKYVEGIISQIPERIAAIRMRT